LASITFAWEFVFLVIRVENVGEPQNDAPGLI
jgi:hypothetical protein